MNCVSISEDLSEISDNVKRKYPLCKNIGNSRQCGMFRDRIKERIEELETNANAVSAKVGRGRTLVAEIISGKSKDPGITKMSEIAAALDTSVAYLIGETDDPATTVTLRTTSPEVPETVLLVNAGAVLESREVAVSFDVAGWGEQGFLLSEADALVLRERLDYAVRDLHENQRSALAQSS